MNEASKIKKNQKVSSLKRTKVQHYPTILTFLKSRLTFVGISHVTTVSYYKLAKLVTIFNLLNNKQNCSVLKLLILLNNQFLKPSV